jgi:hypothetical protein
MVYADLHVHTDNSDGTLSLGEVPAAAARSGVSVVGVTDHDRFHPGFDAPVVEREGVVLVHGIELRVGAPGQRADLLGYGVEPTADLRHEVDRLQKDRRERGRRIVECLETRLDVALDVAITEGLGRPHIARAVVEHPATAYDDIGAVFDALIGDDGPCFVAREVPSFDRGVALLREASAVVGLAHPLRYPDPEAALALCEDLDAVERYYPYGGPAGHPANGDAAQVDAAIQEHDLLRTGGSDAHGTDLGLAGLSTAEYETLAEHLPPVA